MDSQQSKPLYTLHGSFHRSSMHSRSQIKRPRQLRINTTPNEDSISSQGDTVFRRPLEIKEYSNKFLRDMSMIEQESKRQPRCQASKRIFRPRLQDKQNSSVKGQNNKNDTRSNSFIQKRSHSQDTSNYIRISTSRALELFSKILRTNKTGASVIQVPRRTLFKNVNFNIQRIQLKQKREKHQTRMKEYCRSMIKSEARTQQVISSSRLPTQNKQNEHRIQKDKSHLRNRLDSMVIDPWQICVDSQY